MCGIAGHLSRGHGVRADLARTFAHALRHRGPDGEGYFDDAHISIAHARLAIIDLSSAATQPLANEDGTIVAAVNGEIYNHVELRAELEAKGHKFRSRSDSEVVVHLYEEEGTRFVRRLRGMFAIALWDQRKQQLLLARDRFGEKPLYWADGPKGFVFASELAPLLCDETLPAELDLDSLDAFLALQYVPAPQTIFRGIHKLEPGTQLVVGESGAPRIEHYYELAWQPEARLDAAEAIREVRRTVEEAVSSRLMSDVPLGAFLSGGVDSSIVVACMARATSRPVKTFSIGFPAADESELPFARMIAARYKTEHHEEIVKPDMIDVLPAIARHHGEPFADPSALPCWYLAEMTRKHVTVALSGDASDEAFGGYRRYVWSHVANRLRALPRPLLRVVAAALTAVPGAKARWLREYGRCLTTSEAERYLRFVGHFTTAERADIYTDALRDTLARDGTARRFAELAANTRGDALGRLMYLDIQTYLPDDILTKVDTATMAHGLESRAPLVDHHVMELAARIPSRLKVRRLKGKHVLKQAFRDLVPDAILYRKKKGFSLPLGRWMRQDLRDFAHDTLTDARARQRGLFQLPAVARLLERHAAGEDHGDRLWNLMVLEIWFRAIVDGRQALIADARRSADAAPCLQNAR